MCGTRLHRNYKQHTTTSSTARRGSHLKHAAEACHLPSCVWLSVAAKLCAPNEPYELYIRSPALSRKPRKTTG